MYTQQPQLYRPIEIMDSKLEFKTIVPIFLTGILIGAHWKKLLSFVSKSKSTSSKTSSQDKATTKSTSSKTSSQDKATTLAKRLKYFCPAQSISYQNTNPLMALSMQMQYIIDDQGNQYLDTRNNVGHVGWQHPFVVKAVQDQTALCNANSRYLHPKRALLAEKLIAHFPKSQEWCVFFVNSGSEANDLALRLARTHTKHYDAIVVDTAYHGHTQATLALSPYKYEHKGGETYQEQWVHKVKCPDTYRGEFCNLDPKQQGKNQKSKNRISKRASLFYKS